MKFAKGLTGMEEIWNTMITVIDTLYLSLFILGKGTSFSMKENILKMTFLESFIQNSISLPVQVFFLIN